MSELVKKKTKTTAKVPSKQEEENSPVEDLEKFSSVSLNQITPVTATNSHRSTQDQPTISSSASTPSIPTTVITSPPPIQISSSNSSPIDQVQESPSQETKTLNLEMFQPFPAIKQETEDIRSALSVGEIIEAIESVPEEQIPHTLTPEQVAEAISRLDEAKQDPTQVYLAEYQKLSSLEKDVLEIAKDILKLKRYEPEIIIDRIERISPLVDELLSKCVAKMTYTKGISKDQIFDTIQTLEKGRWIVTTQRRTKQEVLESPILKNILKFIHEHPGTHARDTDIETELKITRNPFIKHVMVLEAFELIRTKKIGRTQNYFVATVPEIFDDFVVLFSNPIVPKILQLLIKQPKLTLSDLAREIGVYHGAIQYHLKTLMAMQLLFKNDNNYSVNRELLKRYNNLYKHPPFDL
jgi:predicted transcriptional regulator